MTVAARHLETRRPRKDRDVTWSRNVTENGVVAWSVWRRDHRNAVHMLSVAFTLTEIQHMECALVARAVRKIKRELRDFVDEIDLAAMEKTS